MENIQINGSGSIAGGSYDSVAISGSGSCGGDLTTESMQVNGSFHSKGKLDADKLEVNGAIKVDGSVYAKAINISGSMHVCSDHLEAEQIDCIGRIHIDGQICADAVYIKGCVKAAEIVGDKVNIYSKPILLTSAVDTVEATTIVLRGVHAQIVNGTNITIGPGCRIENLDCIGMLSIDKHSIVNCITGNYQKK